MRGAEVSKSFLTWGLTTDMSQNFQFPEIDLNNKPNKNILSNT